MIVRVDSKACCGHGRCYALCPEVFGEDDDGYPVIASPAVPAAQENRVRRAADNCPEAAIEILPGSDEPGA